jgi:spore germination protein GerM
MKTLFTTVCALLLGFACLSFECPAQTTKSVKIYLVALSDNGKNGRKIGCDDSLIAVTREVRSTGAPLKAALEALLATPAESSEGGRQLGNYWKGSDLKLASVSISKGTATIKIRGTLTVAGVCDEPRIIEQIEATAKQFKPVKKVKVTVNGTALREAIR